MCELSQLRFEAGMGGTIDVVTIRCVRQNHFVCEMPQRAGLWNGSAPVDEGAGGGIW